MTGASLWGFSPNSTVIVQSLSHVRLSATPWTAARQASLSFTTSWNLLKLMSTGSVMPSNHLISVASFSSHLQSFPASGSFPMSQLFTSGGQTPLAPSFYRWRKQGPERGMNHSKPWGCGRGTVGMHLDRLTLRPHLSCCPRLWLWAAK